MLWRILRVVLWLAAIAGGFFLLRYDGARQPWHTLHDVTPVVVWILWGGVLIRNHIKKRREYVRPPAATGLFLGIDEHDRGEWLYSPRADGSTEIELLLHGRKWVATFPYEEKRAYREAIADMTRRLNAGTPRIDVNAAFAERIGRAPFGERVRCLPAPRRPRPPATLSRKDAEHEPRSAPS